MSGRRSRDKGARTERAVVRMLQAQGIVATKISGIYKPGADIIMPLLGTDRAVEVKCRAAGFKPAKPREPCNHGLFGDEAKQLDLSMARKPLRDA
jgi:hypothetical protein